MKNKFLTAPLIFISLCLFLLISGCKSASTNLNMQSEAGFVKNDEIIDESKNNAELDLKTEKDTSDIEPTISDDSPIEKRVPGLPTPPEYQEPSVFYNPKEIIIVHSNVAFIIALPSNPSTGYTWVAFYDSDHLSLIEKNHVTDQAERKNVGAGGTDYFRFKANKVGFTNIKFIYAQHWDGGSFGEELNSRIEIK